MVKKLLSPLHTERLALEYVKDWYRKQGIELKPPGKGEFGFDLKTSNGLKFIEVKGTTATTDNVGFRQISNLEYARAKECKRNKISYEFHLITEVNSRLPKHYILLALDIIRLAKPAILWEIPLRKRELEKWRVSKENQQISFLKKHKTK